ncbi:MAG: LysM peptidoglycan-binding domain-containing protein [Candidatus Marinimicrobia bacterium]|jgi:membrane-bound lytic murein transglycosylase D|nr:LysM peptidoglycan-binding domain-containing protein [Candidatus Neomarinimicrobiota bacterium]MDP6610917.1 LysM peptidoglycan-binding domain-containing protein [Candidatus Neomarinimicrobiota bacterium]|tara:strand:+ start:28478 stop:30037 length:1560 start_codon:yes stop_codon:yes gene_type:complete
MGLSQEEKPIQTTQGQYENGNGFENNQNRLPQLLRDIKVLLSDALIADVMEDTLEVVYTLNRIFDFLTEADQYGDMNDEDREEFNRFEESLVELYTHHFNTLDKEDAAITAEQLRMEVTSITEPLEVEMGASQFTVLDDRDGHIPLVRNKKVDQYIHYFQTKGRRQFEIWLDRLDVYGPMINHILNDCNLPPELVFLAMIESGLNPKAYSKAAANGMWQFIYSTGKLYGLERNWYVDERRDPEKATRAACAYLTDLYDEFDNWYLALSAYNAGEGRIRRATRLHQTSDFWQLHSLPRETRNYIPYFLAAAIIAKNPENYGFYVKEKKQLPFDYDIVTIEKSADLTVLARSAEITFKSLQTLNPELRQSATPTESYALKIPKGKKDIFMYNYNALPENERFAPQFITHKVRNGESLWTIAKKYRVSVHDLAAVNKIRNRSMIRIGQKFTIPVPGMNLASIPRSVMPGYNKITYKVRRGDTLGHIAEDYDTRASNIRKWNGLKYGQHIFPGQKLTLWIKQG